MSKYDDEYEEGEYLAEDGEIKARSKSDKHRLQQQPDDISDMSDTQDSLEIRPPQARVRSKEERAAAKRRGDRGAVRGGGGGGYEEERRQHRKSHHRAREHRGERRRHRDRRDAKERERRHEHKLRRHEGSAPLQPAPLMSLPTPQIEDLRSHLERRGVDKGGDTSRPHRRPVEPPPQRKPPPETPQQREERLEKERRMERFLNAEREREKLKEISRRDIEMRKSRRERENVDEGGDRERSRSRERKRHRNADVPAKGGTKHEEIIVSGSDDEEEAGSREDGEDNEEQSEAESSGDNEEEEGEESTAESESGSGSSSESESSGSEEDSDNKESEEGEQEQVAKAVRNSDQEDDDHAIENTPPRSDVDAAEEDEIEELDPLAGLPFYLPAIQGCRNVEEFQCLNRIEEGTYGVVYRARDKRTEEIVALKRLKMEKEKEGFPITSLREINTLLKAQHKNIVTVREIVVGCNMDKIFIVMDYVEHDLKSLMETMKHKKQVFLPGETKCLMEQLLRAVSHLHDNWILHRDLKTSNLLLSHRGVLKVGDFGLAREYGSPLKAYTPVVVTLWYRAPELLLGAKEYSTPIDVWSVGCIFGELLLMEALFPGKSELDQLNKIFKMLGTPNERIWPGYSKLPHVQKMNFSEFPVSHLRTRFATTLTEKGFELMNSFLTFDPAQRITAETALKHQYFEETPRAIDPAMFPTWPAKSELGHKKAAASPKPPSGGREYKDLGNGEEELSAAGRGLFEVRKSVIGAGFNLRF